MLYFMSAVLLVTGSSTGNESIQQVITHSGATIRLNCTGMSDQGTWRGPDLTNTEEEGIDLCIIPFFDGHAKNPKVKVANVKLDTESVKKYDLVISNVTAHNLGSYQCQIRNSKVDTTFITREYQVSFKNTNKYGLETTGATTKNEPDLETTAAPTTDTDTHSASRHNQQLFFPIFGGLTGGLFFLLVYLILFCYYTKRRMIQDFQPSTAEAQYDESWTINYNSSELRINPNNNDFRQTEHNTSNSIPVSEENTEQGERLENVMDDEENSNGSSNIEAFSIDTNGYENRYQSLLHDSSSEDHPYCGCIINQKINDTGLNYSEIIHEPGPSSGIGVIHGIDDRVPYVEIDHGIIFKTERLSDENIFENDSYDFEK